MSGFRSIYWYMTPGHIHTNMYFYNVYTRLFNKAVIIHPATLYACTQISKYSCEMVNITSIIIVMDNLIVPCAVILIDLIHTFQDIFTGTCWIMSCSCTSEAILNNYTNLLRSEDSRKIQTFLCSKWTFLVYMFHRQTSGTAIDCSNATTLCCKDDGYSVTDNVRMRIMHDTADHNSHMGHLCQPLSTPQYCTHHAGLTHVLE